MKKTGVLTEDFEAIVLAAIAGRVIDEMSLFLNEDELLVVHRHKSSAEAFLKKHAEDTYRAQVEQRSGTLYKIKDASLMRDQLTVFMRHWLSAWIKENHPALFKNIPYSFVNGVFHS